MPDAPPRVRDLLTRGGARLRRAGSETPELDAAILLAHSLGLSRASLYARTLEPVSAATHESYDAVVEQRAHGVPVAYLTGTKEFMGLPFAVTPSVLVPRPETELLVEWALAWLAAHPDRSTVVEVGTGSGAIAISVAACAPHTRVFASDLSRDALLVATANARTHQVTDRLQFVCGDLLTWLGHSADLLLANLPYLTDAQADSPELAAEPRLALAGGEHDGFGLYRTLLAQSVDRIAPSGALAFEIDPAQADTARRLSAETFPGGAVMIHADLAGLARFVSIERPL